VKLIVSDASPLIVIARTGLFPVLNASDGRLPGACD
jgi:hypothetical protein